MRAVSASRLFQLQLHGPPHARVEEARGQGRSAAPRRQGGGRRPEA
jgi:hypothetical protein